jgi:5-methylcytosine-specific restriction endonuclease McrA
MSRPYDHRKAIALAKIREGYKCELRCGSELNIHGHHILDYSFGGEATPENILVVCEKCHEKIHHGEIYISSYDYSRGKNNI